jgi:hypothetical protein
MPPGGDAMRIEGKNADAGALSAGRDRLEGESTSGEIFFYRMPFDVTRYTPQLKQQMSRMQD